MEFLNDSRHATEAVDRCLLHHTFERRAEHGLLPAVLDGVFCFFWQLWALNAKPSHGGADVQRGCRRRHHLHGFWDSALGLRLRWRRCLCHTAPPRRGRRIQFKTVSNNNVFGVVRSGHLVVQLHTGPIRRPEHAAHGAHHAQAVSRVSLREHRLGHRRLQLWRVRPVVQRVLRLQCRLRRLGWLLHRHPPRFDGFQRKRVDRPAAACPSPPLFGRRLPFFCLFLRSFLPHTGSQAVHRCIRLDYGPSDPRRRRPHGMRHNPRREGHCSLLAQSTPVLCTHSADGNTVSGGVRRVRRLMKTRGRGDACCGSETRRRTGSRRRGRAGKEGRETQQRATALPTHCIHRYSAALKRCQRLISTQI